MNLIFRKFSIYYNIILSRYKYSTIKLQSSKTRQTFKIFSIIEKMHKKKKREKKREIKNENILLNHVSSPPLWSKLKFTKNRFTVWSGKRDEVSLNFRFQFL